MKSSNIYSASRGHKNKFIVDRSVSDGANDQLYLTQYEQTPWQTAKRQDQVTVGTYYRGNNFVKSNMQNPVLYSAMNDSDITNMQYMRPLPTNKNTVKQRMAIQNKYKFSHVAE